MSSKNRICVVPGCDRSVEKRDWCGKHYQRWRAHGDPRICRPKRPASDRFWEKVDRAGPDDCWMWLGSKNARGYGGFHAVPETTVVAHRFAYEDLIGPIPDGLTIDHLCRNTLCVNPAHMEPVTMRENILRGDGPSAKAARMTHCKYGHPLTEDNIYGWRGKRRCLTCHRRKT